MADRIISSTLIAFSLCVIPLIAQADGIETLGDPSIPIASGSGVVAAGTGLLSQPGTINIEVPAGAQVQQVLLYWQGFNYRSDLASGSSATLNPGGVVNGTLIGHGAGGIFSGIRSYTYRADITALGIINPGPNSISVSNVNFTYASNGAGIMVIYDDGSGLAPYLLKDGHDYAFQVNPSDPHKWMVPQLYTFDPAPVQRSASLYMFFSSVAGASSGGGSLRPTSIEVTIGGAPPVVYSNYLNSSDGDEWDTLVLPVEIPAGVDSLTVQAFSRNDGSSLTLCLPASFVWNASGLFIADAAPDCQIGGPYSSACQGYITEIQLDGGASSDPEGLPLSYFWQTDCQDAAFSNMCVNNPVLSLAIPGSGQEQQCNVSLEVSDGVNTRQCQTTVSAGACPVDCLGVPNGTAVYDINGVCCLPSDLDQCGVCFGKDECVEPPCFDIDVSSELTILSQTAKAQYNLLKTMLRRYKRSSCGKSAQAKRFIRRSQKEAAKLFQESSAVVLEFPAVVTVCDASAECIKVDYTLNIKTVESNSAKLSKMTRTAVTRRYACLSGGVCSDSASACLQRIRERMRQRRVDIRKAAELNSSLKIRIEKVPVINNIC